VRTTLTRLAALALFVTASSACGDVARDGRSPVQVVISSLQAAAGGDDEFAGFLQSDVITQLDEDDPASCTILNDSGEVTMPLVLRVQGQPGLAAAPSALNQVTFTQYRVAYRRPDNRNTPGVDVPQPLVSAATFTVPTEGQVTAAFNLVRQTAKLEPPLLALRRDLNLLSMVADVTFIGRDQAGNDVVATGSIGVTFANFGGDCTS